MDNVKPWQIVLMVLAVLAIGFTTWRLIGGSGHVPKTSGYMTVDIYSGQLYDVRKGKAKGVPLPAKNPDTGKRSLYPAYQIDELTWEIPLGYEAYLTENVRKGSKLKDGKYQIEVLPDDPIVIVLLK